MKKKKPFFLISFLFLLLVLFLYYVHLLLFNVLGLSSLRLNSLGSRSYVTKFHAQALVEVCMSQSGTPDANLLWLLKMASIMLKG